MINIFIGILIVLAIVVIAYLLLQFLLLAGVIILYGYNWLKLWKEMKNDGL